MSDLDQDEEDEATLDRAIPSEGTLQFTSRIAAALLIVGGIAGFVSLIREFPVVGFLILFLFAAVMAAELRHGGRFFRRTAAVVVIGTVVALSRFPGLVWISYCAWRDRRKTVENDIVVGVKNDGTVTLDMRERHSDGEDEPAWASSNLGPEDLDFLLSELTEAKERAARYAAKLAARPGPGGA
jgi:hypothetical protein